MFQLRSEVKLTPHFTSPFFLAHTDNYFLGSYNTVLREGSYISFTFLLSQTIPFDSMIGPNVPWHYYTCRLLPRRSGVFVLIAMQPGFLPCSALLPPSARLSPGKILFYRLQVISLSFPMTYNP